MRAQIWDTTGNEEYQFLATTHYRYAVGAFVMYDVTNFSSFANCREWLQKVREYCDEYVQIALIANKFDLVQDQIDMS